MDGLDKLLKPRCLKIADGRLGTMLPETLRTGLKSRPDVTGVLPSNEEY